MSHCHECKGCPSVDSAALSQQVFDFNPLFSTQTLTINGRHTTATFELWGGGAGGAAFNPASSSLGGGGGGAGAYLRVPVPISPKGNTFLIAVAGPVPAGTNGQNTVVTDTCGSIVLTANGGMTPPASNTSQGGVGGVATAVGPVAFFCNNVESTMGGGGELGLPGPRGAAGGNAPKGGQGGNGGTQIVPLPPPPPPVIPGQPGMAPGGGGAGAGGLLTMSLTSPPSNVLATSGAAGRVVITLGSVRRKKKSKGPIAEHAKSVRPDKVVARLNR